MHLFRIGAETYRVYGGTVRTSYESYEYNNFDLPKGTLEHHYQRSRRQQSTCVHLFRIKSSAQRRVGSIAIRGRRTSYPCAAMSKRPRETTEQTYFASKSATHRAQMEFPAEGMPARHVQCAET